MSQQTSAQDFYQKGPQFLIKIHSLVKKQKPSTLQYPTSLVVTRPSKVQLCLTSSEFNLAEAANANTRCSKALNVCKKCTFSFSPSEYDVEGVRSNTLCARLPVHNLHLVWSEDGRGCGSGWGWLRGGVILAGCIIIRSLTETRKTLSCVRTFLQAISHLSSYLLPDTVHGGSCNKLPSL